MRSRRGRARVHAHRGGTARRARPDELLERWERTLGGLARVGASLLDRRREKLVHAHERLRRAPALALERKRARLEHAQDGCARCPRAQRSPAGTRSSRRTTGSSSPPQPLDGDQVDVEVAEGASERRSSEAPSRTYEDAQRELEADRRAARAGTGALDEAIALWERGEELYKLCVGKLDAAQGKIEELAKRVESASRRPSSTRSTRARAGSPESATVSAPRSPVIVRRRRLAAHAGRDAAARDLARRLSRPRRASTAPSPVTTRS